MPSPRSQISSYELIGRSVGRIQSLCAEISRSHELGVSVGDYDHPWTLEYHHVVAGIYLEVMPAKYALRVATCFERSRGLMSTIGQPPGVDDEDWAIVSEYLGSVTAAICSRIGADPVGLAAETVLVGASTPGVFPYSEVAPLVSVVGIERLHRAASGVQRGCERASGHRPSEASIEILELLSRGQHISDIALGVGLSKRTLERRLALLWKELGVANAHEAALLGIRQGWL